MAIKLNGSTSGSVALDAPADTSPSGTDVTLTLPTSAGSSGQYLQTNGNGTLSWQTVSASNLTRSTAQATTSGTSVEFGNIPSGVRRISVMFNGVSSNATSYLAMQISDSATYDTTGYDASSAYVNTSGGTDKMTRTSEFLLTNSEAASTTWTGLMTLVNIDGNTWVGSGTAEGGVFMMMMAGDKTLSGTLDRLKIFPSSGSFNAGTVNIMYED